MNLMIMFVSLTLVLSGLFFWFDDHIVGNHELFIMVALSGILISGFIHLFTNKLKLDKEGNPETT